jgi:hypothetical protein
MNVVPVGSTAYWPPPRIVGIVGEAIVAGAAVVEPCALPEAELRANSLILRSP